ncbi:hypothetical protein KSP39_PZI016437 [Platanthera zijinensis]|uniref:Fungal lipase-type domain-containing protein n=1 Tax=Platanthera zijinensis TaxID=2320716 RepID=A0AAP0B6N9_9ASPA
MGRRNVVVALRGTSTCLEWAENLRLHLAPLDAGDSKVACGLRSLYTTAGDGVPSLSTAVAEEIRRLIMLYNGQQLSITVTGHSLGAALAILLADDLIAGGPEISTISMPPIAVFSFGGPKVGNRAFAERLEEQRGLKVLRVVNARDFVTWMPASIGDGYEHVGRELRVDSKVSPFLKPNADPACCHDLEAYLHLVDVLGGGGGGILFLPNASLARLLSQQRGNVKKLYVSKYRDLGQDLAGGCTGSPPFRGIHFTVENLMTLIFLIFYIFLLSKDMTTFRCITVFLNRQILK